MSQILGIFIGISDARRAKNTNGAIIARNNYTKIINVR